jgi:3-oxoadipate enol-lactonase
VKIEFDGNRIEYREEGQGIPLILIHGFPLNQKMWDDQVAALHDHCRVITLDLPGFGLSDPSPGSYSMAQMAADVRGLMATLAIDRAVIVGLSMGGYIALAFYRLYSEAVLAMVLADTRASEDTAEARLRRLETASQIELEGVHAIAEYMISVGLSATTVSTRPDVVAKVRAMIEGNSPRVLAAVQRAMADRADSNDLLSSIEGPVLLIAGEEDVLTPSTVAEEMHSRIPHSTLRVIAGAGHFSNLDRREQFNRALIEFVELLQANGGQGIQRAPGSLSS